MIDKLKTVRDTLLAHPILSKTEYVQDVRRAIKYLEQIKPPLWKNVWNWVRENILLSFLALAYALWVLIWLMIFGLRPLWLLRINRAFEKLDFQISAKVITLKLPFRFFLFVGFLNYRPRVLDAWVKAHIAICRERFADKETVDDRKIHISVPVELNRRKIPEMTSKDLRPTLSRRLSCLLIWGEGGSGKTSLACQIAHLAMAEEKEARLCDYLIIPILIEHELSPGEEQSSFIDAVGRQLQGMTDQAEPILKELLEHLLRQRRVLVIVDHFSEMSNDTRDKIKPDQRDFPANAFVVTSRLEEPLGGVTKTVIKPLRIRQDRLSPFMEAYLTHQGKSDIFTDSEFHNACRRLSEMVGYRGITILLAKLYADQMIAAKTSKTDDKLPDNIPDLMLHYLNELNISVTENRLDDLTVHRDAKGLAWACLKETFRPGSVRINDAVAILTHEDAKVHLKYQEESLRLIKIDPIRKDRFKFLLDPLAEYLAGLHLLELYGKKEDSWKKFLTKADAKEGAPESIKGFLLAVRDCCIAKGKEAKIPDFLEEELGRRAGLDPEVLERIRMEKRIQQLILQLGFTESSDRNYAAKALGKIGPDAKAAVPALIEALNDQDKGVRLSAAEALNRIRS